MTRFNLISLLTLRNFTGVSTSNFPYILYTSLKNNPSSWKLYLLSSFYWRFKGNAKEAIGESMTVALKEYFI